MKQKGPEHRCGPFAHPGSGPFGDVRLRVTGGTRRSFLLVYDLIVSINYIIPWSLRLGAPARGCAGTVPRSATVGLPWSTSAGTGRLVQ
jgi:hypothetical protein